MKERKPTCDMYAELEICSELFKNKLTSTMNLNELDRFPSSSLTTFPFQLHNHGSTHSDQIIGNEEHSPLASEHISIEWDEDYRGEEKRK